MNVDTMQQICVHLRLSAVNIKLIPAPLSPSLCPGARPALLPSALMVCGLAGAYVVPRGCMGSSD